ncbi:MAG: phosphonate C-P lyase system protein PhnH [Brevinematales bacterium]|nr:phosphonate C-P lyase system protein PhnH [Brevinematales bacterium]
MFDEIFITQQTFRTLMNAMANPGKFYNLKNDDSFSTLQKVCLTLLDNEVNFSIVGEKLKENLIEQIISLTNSNYTNIEEADYIIVCGGANENILKNIKIGSLEEPEKGVTLIYDVQDIEKEPSFNIKISGPGIKNSNEISIKGITRQELERIEKINLNFPLGIDIIFCYKNDVMCIPRSTRIEFL